MIVEGEVLSKNSLIRGLSYIGRGTKVVNSYIEPFTSIRDDCEITDSEIEHSVVLDNAKIRGYTLWTH